MTVGGMFDTEVDEVFAVIAGSATVTRFADDGSELEEILLQPGTICRLTAGTRTRWDVSAPLRKVYVIGAIT
jgi:uncharacterized cupin superfamily protein